MYYPPRSVVNFIIKSIQIILESEFQLENTFLDPNVTVLDFAVGTGTFLLEIFQLVLEEADAGLIDDFIHEYLLKNFYGFEKEIAPYVIGHLKLNQYLLGKGYSFQETDRAQLYLTNTLNLDDKKNTLANFFLKNFTDEGKKAEKIKN